MSLRVCVNTRLFFTSPRCFCKRRLKSLTRRSLSSRAASTALYSCICLRRSLSFGTFRLPSCDKACGNRQLVTGQADSFFGDVFTHAADFEDDPPWFDDCDPVIDCAFAFAH